MIKRIIGAILFVAYAIIAITVTVLLLSFNEYNCSEIGDYTVYIASNDALEPEYEKGSILLIQSTSDKHVQIGDEIFLYKVINSQEYELVNRTLTQKVQQGNHIVYYVNGGEAYASEYFIGKADDTTVIEGWGTLLSILESKWGYLFCIVIVSLLLFLQEVFELIIEIRYGAHKASNSKGTKKSTAKTATAKKSTSTGAKKTTTATKKVASTAKTVTKTVEAATQANNEIQTGEKEG